MEQVKVPGGLVPRLPSPKPRHELRPGHSHGHASRARSRSRSRHGGPQPEAEALPHVQVEAVPSSTVALLVEGFKEEALDGWYRRRDKCIVTGSPAFFHGSSGSPKLFMYKQASGRWVISPVRGGAGGEADLLRAARAGQDRGVACQKAARGSSNSWREYYQGRWVETKLRVEMFSFEEYERYKRRHGDWEERQAPVAALPELKESNRREAPMAAMAPLPEAKDLNRRQVEVCRAERLPPKSAPVGRTTPVTEKEVEKMLLAAQKETKHRERLVQQREEQLMMEEEKAKAKAKGTSTLLAVAAKLHSPPEAGFMSSSLRGLAEEMHPEPEASMAVSSSKAPSLPPPQVAMAAQTAKATPAQVAIAASTPKAPGEHHPAAPQLMEQLADQSFYQMAPLGLMASIGAMNPMNPGSYGPTMVGTMPGYFPHFMPQAVWPMPPPPPPGPPSPAESKPPNQTPEGSSRAPQTPPKKTAPPPVPKAAPKEEKMEKVKSHSPETERVRSFLQCLNGAKDVDRERRKAEEEKNPAPSEGTNYSKGWEAWDNWDDWKDWKDWKGDWHEDHDSKWKKEDWSDWEEWKWRNWSGQDYWQADWGEWKDDKAKKKDKKEEKKEKKEKKKEKKEKEKKDASIYAASSSGQPPPGPVAPQQQLGQVHVAVVEAAFVEAVAPAAVEAAVQARPSVQSTPPDVNQDKQAPSGGPAAMEVEAKVEATKENSNKSSTSTTAAPLTGALVASGPLGPLGTFPATVAGFYHFVVERERIRLKRTRGDAFPWTSDPILQHLRMRNVKRQHDRSNVFMRRLLKPVADSIEISLAESLWNICIWRRFGSLHFINKVGYMQLPSTAEEMPDFVQIACELWQSGLHACTDAYGPAMRCHALELSAWHSNTLATELSIFSAEKPTAGSVAKRRRKGITQEALQKIRKAYSQLWNEKMGAQLLSQCHCLVKLLVTKGAETKSPSTLLSSVKLQGASDGVYAAELFRDFISLVQTDRMDNLEKLMAVNDATMDASTKRVVRRMLPDLKVPPLQLLTSIFEQRLEHWPSTIEEQKSIEVDLGDVRAMLAEFDRYLRAVDGRPTRMPFEQPLL